MKYAKLGKSDLNVSRICMGCMGFGNASIGQHSWTLDEAQTREIMDGLNRVVKAGKVRYIGISNCFAWQLAKANYYARENGMTEFISIQGHYNLIAREEEREMALFCYSENIAMTPYSSLAGGRLSKRPGETSKRLEEDAYAKFKYDATAEADARIIARVAELADKRNVSYLEEMYVPHALVGVMAQNGKQKAGNVV